jgi:transposase-like protein
MRPDYVTNPLYFPFKKAEMGHTLILKRIKDLHEKGLTVRDIAKELNLDHDAVSRKLKAMGFTVWRSGGKRVPAGYPCAWCGKMMDYVNVSTGSRKQRYCSTKCVSKAKELRKYLRGQKVKYGLAVIAEMKAHVINMPEDRRRIVLEGIETPLLEKK